jgi:hypothetical protein
MAQYSYAQLKSLWTQQGGNPLYADLAAAVAMAESGGRSNATNTNTDGSIDRGLWQVNSVHGGLSTTDPIANAKAAVKISSNGKNWSPWVTFKTGAYKKYLSPTTLANANLPNATTAGISIPGVGGISVSGVVQSAVKAMLGLMGLGDMRDMLERAGLIILGFALVIMGIHILSSGGGSSQTNVFGADTGRRSSSSSSKPVSEGAKSATKKSLAGEAVEAAAIALWQTPWVGSTQSVPV